MEKAYEPGKHEARIYKMWEESGAFKPIDDPKAEPYTILMPPPNANGDLHIGHTLTTTLEDIMIRHARMNGKAALFLPGADHAGFETQVVFERKLQEEGKSRFDYDRKTLYQMIWDYVQANKGNMEDQQRRIGASVDWDRNTFTLDPQVVKLTQDTFQKLWDDGLVYRGKRIVNYCTFHGTSFSDLEVEYKTEKSKLWHIRYPVADSDEEIVVATTRPETMLGDTAVAVHPDDKRYKNLIGQVVKLPLSQREIPIVADVTVDPKFGTGAVKVTPAHDATDFEIAERHNLPAIEVIGKDGLMTSAVPKEYQGQKAADARKQVADALKAQEFLVKIENYTHSVGHCYKCGTVIEPLIVDQWLIHMKPLAQKAIKAFEEGKIEIVPHSRLKVMYQWLENIRDWNISRQIVWGIPIPAFIAEDGDAIVDVDETSDKIKRGGKTYHRDSDTFDTWFSSGQWPEATLKYPDGADFNRFYPTSVMETAGEIIFFWVARMVMLGLYLTDEVPFRVIYLHGLVLDEHGKKMSKSKGNVLAPAPLLDRYGADALRMGLIANRSAGMNQGFSEKRVEGYRNFCNKLWNVARFIIEKAEGYSPVAPAPKNLADEWILNRFSQETVAITKAIEEYRFGEAGDHIYSLLWNDLADWYIEASKVEFNPPVAIFVLETILKLAHPFAPFVTETIWQNMAWQKQNLIVSAWPDLTQHKSKSASDFNKIMALISQIRTINAEIKLTKPKLTYAPSKLLEANLDLVAKLANLGAMQAKQKGSGLRVQSTDFDAWLDVDEQIISKYRSSLEHKRKEAGEYLKRLESQLANKRYVESAPAELVKQTRDRKAETELLVSKLDEQIKTIN
jgi:valyl-tRNA synthetase